MRFFKQLLGWFALMFCSLTVHAQSCVWYGDEQTIYRIALDGNAGVDRTATPPDRALVLAMPGGDCGVWALTGKSLLRYNADGGLETTVTLKSLGKQLQHAGLLAADPADQSAWIAGAATLAHFSASGQLLGSYGLPVSAQQLVLAQDGTVWLYGDQHIVHLGSDGKLLANRPLDLLEFTLSGRLVVDSVGDRLWLAGLGRLQQFRMSQLNKPASTILLQPAVDDLTLDPVAGTLWVLTANRRLLGYSRDGKLTAEHSLAPDNPFNDRALEFDAVNQSLWVIGNKDIERRATDGGPGARLHLAPHIVPFAVPPFAMRPELGWDRPSAGSVVNTATPPLAFSYRLMCGEQSCPAPVDSHFTLDATLDGKAFTATIDPAAGSAVFIPAAPLQEGTHAVSARARSAYGRLSKVVEGAFSIDTVPPAFVALHPADGSVVRAATLNVSGAVDDPDAAVVLEEAGKWSATGANPARQKFDFGVTLKSGVNRLTLSAVDQAGNVATIHPMYTFAQNELSIAFTSPAAELSVDGNRIDVAGIFHGPPGTVLSIVCGALGITGDTFAAQGIPLAYGRNAITATATDPGGNTVSKTIYVNSTAPSINVSAPAANATVLSQGVVVRGEIQASPNSQVRVNGQLAAVNGSAFEITLPLVYGANPVEAKVVTPTGAQALRALNVNNGLPSVNVEVPVNLSEIPASAVTVTGTYAGPAGAQIKVNDTAGVIDGKRFYVTNVPLAYGSNILNLVSTAPGAPPVRKLLRVQSSAPTVTITSPGSGIDTPANSFPISGTVLAPEGSVLRLNGAVVPYSGRSFSAPVPLVFGSNVITASVTSPAGVTGSTSIQITSSAPTVAIDSPADNSIIAAATITITGTFKAQMPASVSANYGSISTSGNQFTITGYRLYPGLNTIRVVVYGPYGGATGSATITVTRIEPSIRITAPADQSTADTPVTGLKGNYVGAPGSRIRIEGPGFNPVWLNPAQMDGASFAIDGLPLVFGPNALKATLVGPDGQTPSATVNVTSTTPSIRIFDPVDGATTIQTGIGALGVYEAPAGSTVTVNGKMAVIDGRFFQITDVALAPGPNTLTATVVTPDGKRAEKSVQVTRQSAKISLDPPSAGAASSDRILVSGSLIAPANTGVTVNGTVASVGADGHFYANDVPLVAGNNTITAVATAADGQQVSASIVIEGGKQAAMAAVASVVRGTAPLTVDFSAIGLSATLAGFTVRPNGPGAPASGPDNSYSYKYDVPGVYLAQVTMHAADGRSDTQQIAIAVTDLDEEDTRFNAIWDAMNGAMLRGDVEAAKGYLTSGARKRYGPVLATLQPVYRSIYDSFSPLMRSRVDDGLAEYALVRPDARGVRQVYLIYFVQDTDGVWRLDSM